MKPKLYCERIQRFLLQLLFRIRARKNILLCKIIDVGKKKHILLIRRSQLTEHMYQANLYPHKVYSEGYIRRVQEKGFGNIPAEEDEHDHKNFPTIYISKEYIINIGKSKLIDEFYITDSLFLLKPALNKNRAYLQRLERISIHDNSWKETMRIQIFMQMNFMRLLKMNRKWSATHKIKRTL